MGQPCLILLRPAPSAVLVRDRGAVARVFPAVLEASEHAPCRAPPRARARRGRRGLALIGARVATLREQADGEWSIANRGQDTGAIGHGATRHASSATPSRLLAPG